MEPRSVFREQEAYVESPQSDGKKCVSTVIDQDPWNLNLTYRVACICMTFRGDLIAHTQSRFKQCCKSIAAVDVS